MARLKRSLWLPIIAIIISSFLVPNIIYLANAPLTYNVTMSGFAFNPSDLTIYVGDTIAWLNKDPVIYTLWFVRVKDGSTYALSDPIPPGGTWAHIFNEAGKLQYYDFKRLWITGFIMVKLAGDVDGSRKVDFRDLFALAAAYCSRPGYPNWNPACDFDGDGHVGFRDLFALAANYGKTY